MEIAVGSGADDYADVGDTWSITAPPEKLQPVLDALEAAKIAVKESSIGFVPKNKKLVSGRDAELLLNLVEILDDHEDVAHVYADFDISDEELAKLS